MIVGLHHAQVCIPRGAEDEARRFYCGVLGLPEVAKPDALAGRGGLWLAAGDRQVHLGTEDGVDRLASKAHLAYEVDDLAAWRRHLEGAGVAAAADVDLPDYIRFFVRDPFGNRIEFTQSWGTGAQPEVATSQ